MKKFYFAVTLVILALSAAFVGYGIYLNTTSHSHIETMLTSRAVSLSGVRVSYRDLYPELRLDLVHLRSRNLADAITQIDGMIEEIYVSQGQDVEQGRPLCRIVNLDVSLAMSRADADIARAEAAYLLAEGTAERNRRLAAEDAVSRSELETSISQMNAAKAELDAARIARRQIEQQRSFQTVTAPISGTVLVLYRHVGDIVNKGMPVLMIADFSKMYFTALVEDEKLRNIAPIEGNFSFLSDFSGMMIKAFDTAARSSFSEDTAFNVEILSVMPPLSESAPVRRVECRIDNNLKILEFGMYGDIIIRKETPKRALAVPIAAVYDLDGPRVYVSDRDSRLAVRGVITGVHDSGYVEIKEGLEEGDIVIVSGIVGLDIGARVEVNVEENLR